jgi:hypothetical protein
MHKLIKLYMPTKMFWTSIVLLSPHLNFLSCKYMCHQILAYPLLLFNHQLDVSPSKLGTCQLSLLIIVWKNHTLVDATSCVSSTVVANSNSSTKLFPCPSIHNRKGR